MNFYIEIQSPVRRVMIKDDSKLEVTSFVILNQFASFVHLSK